MTRAAVAAPRHPARRHSHSSRCSGARSGAPQGRLAELINRVAGRRLYGWDVRRALAVIEP